MPWKWSPTALRQPLRYFTRNSLAQPSVLTCQHVRSTSRDYYSISGRYTTRTFTSTRSTSGTAALKRSVASEESQHVYLKDNSVSNTVESLSETTVLSMTIPLHPDTPMTAAQISRAAAQTIRLAFRQKEPQNAFFILNSLHYSRYRDRPNESIPQHISGLINPIDFGQSVSLRLSSHAMLHALLRSGSHIKAAEQAKVMMEEGIRLRTTTLHAVMRAAAESAPLLPHPLSESSFFGRSSMRSLAFDVSEIADSGTRYAVTLLMVARQYRQRRSHQMFFTLIKAIAVRGQLALAAALFALAVRDWQLQVMSIDQVQIASSPSEVSQTQPVQQLSPSPSIHLMGPILRGVKNRLVNPTLSSSDAALVDGAQALVTITSLLEDRTLPFGTVSPLLRNITSCPRLEGVQAWISRNNTEHPVDAFGYLHDVVAGLAQDAPIRRTNWLDNKGSAQIMPPLDIVSYNALLHYALRHRLSPSMASQILHHMMEKRDPPVNPDIGTYNILIRSASLMRRNEIAERAIQHVLQLGPDAQAATIESHGAPPLPTSLDAGQLKSISELRFAVEHEAFYLPEAQHDVRVGPQSSIVPDTYTTTAYISHLVATGQPEKAAALMFALFPELQSAEHTRWGTGTLKERLDHRGRARANAVARGAMFGPALFTALLNAIVKAGKTGAAEHLWRLAHDAQRASWFIVPEGADAPAPWTLPIAAYTLMMQCYADEARPSRHCSIPHAEMPESARVWGWGFEVHKDTGPERSRGETAYHMGSVILQQLRTIPRKVSSLRTKQGLIVPSPAPDARFYNAALELFMRVRTQSGPTESLDLILAELARDMSRAGFTVPIDLCIKLQDIWEPPTRQRLLKARRRTRYAVNHTLRKSVHEARLSTYKDRGLPWRVDRRIKL